MISISNTKSSSASVASLILGFYENRSNRKCFNESKIIKTNNFISKINKKINKKDLFILFGKTNPYAI